MSNTRTSNGVTDRTNAVSENIIGSQVNIVNDDPQNANEGNQTSFSHSHKERPDYEVVFFARYGSNPRPPIEKITDFFNKYGVVHHVNCPEGRNYAFVFMSSLNTTAEHRRTRTTISQIIKDMTPETRFHLTVASSNRTPQFFPTRRYNYYRGYQPRQYYNYGRSELQQYNNDQPHVRQPRYAVRQENRRPYVRNSEGSTTEYRQENRRPYVHNSEGSATEYRQKQYMRPGTYKPFESSYNRNTTENQGSVNHREKILQSNKHESNKYESNKYERNKNDKKINMSKS